jgi:hypothetical protein
MRASDAERLQFKVAFQIVPQSDHEVTLYAGDGAGLELATEDCDVQRLCELLSCGASRSELIDELACPAGRLEPILAALIEAGWLAQMPPVPDWPVPLIERMDRQTAYFRRYEDPRRSRYDFLSRLRDAHVLLLGVGSLGSWCLQHLVATGVGRITAVDCDRVSPCNLARQSFYRSADIGTKKVEAAARIVAELSEWVEFRAIDRRLESRACVSAVLRGSEKVDLVILTADEPIWEIAVFTAEAAREADVPLLRGNSLGIGPLTRFGQSACPACDWPRALAAAPNAERLVAYYRGSARARPPKAAISTHVAVAGSCLAQEAISFLSGAGPVRTENARLVVRDGLAIQRVAFERHRDCPVCAAAPRGTERSC